MAISKRGIKRMIITASGQLGETSPSGLITTGTRKNGGLVISPLDTIKDHRERELRNLINFKAEMSSYQGRMRFLDMLISYLGSGYDAQIACVDQTADGDGGIFNFVAMTGGLDFGIEYNAKERFLNLVLETAMEYEAAQTFIGASDNDELAPAITNDPISGGNEYGQNFSLYAHPYYCSIECPSGTELFSKKEIVDRKFSIKTKGYKNAYNEVVQPYLEVMLEITGADATITKMANILNKDMGASVVHKEYIGGTSFYEKYSIAANLVTHKEEFNLGDEKREAKITISGLLTPDNFTFAYGSSNGGDGDGSTELKKLAGGTCTIA